MAAVVEIDALMRALVGCRGHAQRQLARRQAALLATLAPPIGGRGRTVRVALAGGALDVPLLALVGSQLHRVAELALEFTCLFEHVETDSGVRFGVRPLREAPAGRLIHRLEIVVGGRGDVAELKVDGRTLRALRVDGEAVNERAIPQARVLLLTAADAAQLTMDPPAEQGAQESVVAEESESVTREAAAAPMEVSSEGHAPVEDAIAERAADEVAAEPPRAADEVALEPERAMPEVATMPADEVLSGEPVGGDVAVERRGPQFAAREVAVPSGEPVVEEAVAERQTTEPTARTTAVPTVSPGERGAVAPASSASEGSADTTVERAGPDQLSLWTDDELAIVPLPPCVAEQLSLWSADGRGEVAPVEQQSAHDAGEPQDDAQDSDEGEVSFTVAAAAPVQLPVLSAFEPGQRDTSLLIVVDEPGDLRLLDAVAGEPGDLREIDRSERPPMSFEELVDGLIDEATADLVGRKVPRTRLRKVDDSELLIEVDEEDSFDIQVDEEKP